VVAATTEVAVTTSPTPRPVVVVKAVVETRSVPFKTSTVYDATLAKGTTRVRTQGVNGTVRLTFEVTYTDGVETGRRLVSQTVIKAAVTKVVVVGTKVNKPTCDPNYSGACVPIASDVDCLGGGGNGPAYVDGPAYVIGTDIYDLDRDGDGVACE